MPGYDYKCSDCDYEFSEYKKIADRKDALQKPCPECGKESIRRLFTPNEQLDPGIINADKNMERSGVLKELNRLKEHHPYMKWKG